MTTASRCHILLGSADPHARDLNKAAKGRGRPKDWTVNADARDGDAVVFYIAAPISAFYATGLIDGDSWINDDPKYAWYGYRMARIEEVKLPAKPFPLREARRRWPEWGHLSQLRRSAQVPEKYANAFLRALKAPRPRARDSETLEAMEGELRESSYLRRIRSGMLRKAALEGARGICAVCRTDYSKVIPPIGQRVLQVHHKQQLSARDLPAVTRVRDLAVVCANCHAMLHHDPLKALQVAALRRKLAGAAGGRRRGTV